MAIVLITLGVIVCLCMLFVIASFVAGFIISVYSYISLLGNENAKLTRRNYLTYAIIFFCLIAFVVIAIVLPLS